MIAINEDCRTQSWQSKFVKLLPRIEQLLSMAFRHLDPDEREEAVQNATVLCLLSYRNLHRRGRAHQASAPSLAWYAVLQVKCGRSAVGRLNSKEVLSRYGQLRSGCKALHLLTSDESDQRWIEQLADERAPVLEQVAARLDVRSWFSTLSPRTKRIAADLAQGETTAGAASKYRLSPGRISQIRRELEASWLKFQHELAPVG